MNKQSEYRNNPGVDWEVFLTKSVVAINDIVENDADDEVDDRRAHKKRQG